MNTWTFFFNEDIEDSDEAYDVKRRETKRIIFEFCDKASNEIDAASYGGRDIIAEHFWGEARVIHKMMVAQEEKNDGKA